jgi:hypothetical protein
VGNAFKLPTFQDSAAGVSQGVTVNIEVRFFPIYTIKVYAGGRRVTGRAPFILGTRWRLCG